jgi:hypothetical protein
LRLRCLRCSPGFGLRLELVSDASLRGVLEDEQIEHFSPF